MGVDAFLFAQKSKECFYFDRVYNLLSNQLYHGGPEQVILAEEKLEESSHDRTVLVPRADLVLVVTHNLGFWVEDDDRHRRQWNREILAFADRHSDDELYFVLRDDGDGDLYSHGVCRGEGFKEIEFREGEVT